MKSHLHWAMVLGAALAAPAQAVSQAAPSDTRAALRVMTAVHDLAALALALLRDAAAFLSRFVSLPELWLAFFG